MTWAIVLAGLVLTIGARGAVRADEAVPPIETIEFFTRPGCPYCERADRWLAQLAVERPGVQVVKRDVAADPRALQRFRALADEAGAEAVSTPAFYVGGRLVIGWHGPETTGRRVLAAVQGRRPDEPVTDEGGCAVDLDAPVEEAECEDDEGELVVDLPLFGRVDPTEIGLPVFTIALGLIDGFNPCAMWVLLFLLSLLVNMRSRSRMFAVAGTFVVVSGIVYFAFMAAWLNFFLLVGMSSTVQILLGGLAVLVGTVHVKDFFAFHRGVTLSIPESARSGLYERVRRILRADNLSGAILGVVALAFLVNVVELLCTAGLPAVYTGVLARQGLSGPARYGYLALYQVFYMLDDALMLLIAIVTLSRHRLQERGGRWLKLISGVVMLALGVVILIEPGLLYWGT